MVRELAKLHLPLPVACITTRTIPAPSLLVEKLSDLFQVPKRLGTTGLENVERLRLKVWRAVEGAGSSLQGNFWVC